MASGEFFPDSWEGMVLGSPFLKGFWSVWDFEERTVGCESSQLAKCSVGVACLLIGESSGVIDIKILKITQDSKTLQLSTTHFKTNKQKKMSMFP